MTLTKLHKRASMEPQSIVAGMSLRWSSVRINSRAMCGIANPMNPIGPQHAVTMAESKPVDTRSIWRTRCTFTPKLVA